MNAHKLVAAVAAVGLSLGLAACSNDDAADNEGAGSSEQTSAQQAAPVAELPTADELNAVLARATDSNLPIGERTNTVQGGETVPELFDVMAQSQQESGANFQVVDPILPGYGPNTVLATVNFTQPEQQSSQQAEDVEFVFEDGQWKLSQEWACTLVSNTLPPEQLPQMCKAPAPADAPAEAPAEQAPAEAPAPEGEYQEAPAL
ncbi:hypothetical protein [uncultured Corynebacterium sp.]|uniref:hypothetical protein n=1 Tax=uncultured Corynebacterium sp. TaxID=159447 RepID=UPI00261E0C49|nr:hypothetical protein [uncultured Corynebacterium sp.]